MRLATPRNGLLAGLALIALTNAVTLGLVAWNRSGEPEALLTLSERELQQPWNRSARHGENSGLALTLRWRVAPAQAPRAESTPGSGTGETPDPAEIDAWQYGSDAHWLDEAKLLELGVPRQPDERRHRNRSRPVLLVLEIDGPAYQLALDRARRHLAAETALRDANVGAREFIDRVKRATDRLQDQEQMASRLFIIDAGLDAATLRQRYPDRRRHAIVPGRIREAWIDPRYKTPRHGYIERLDAAIVNVPQAMRPAVPVDTWSGPRHAPQKTERFTAEIAFGRRLEPWLQSVQRQAVESN